MSRANTHRRARRTPRRRTARFHGAADVRGLDGFLTSPTGAAVVALIAFLFLQRKTVAQVTTQVASAVSDTVFAAALPAAIGRWAPEILRAAKAYDVNPWVLAGIMARESGGGVAPGYIPKGNPNGTGDFIPRKTGPYAKLANPMTGLPPDGKGWGRGLMQIDYGAHHTWVTSNPWWEPQTNINKAAELLRWNLDYFRRPAGGPVKVDQWRITTGIPKYKIQPWNQRYPGRAFALSVPDPRPLSGEALYEAAIAAYNAGPSGVLQAVASGVPAEAVTSGQDYVAWFTSRIAAWQSKT